MQTVRVFTGAMPETPLFNVYLGALRGKRALKVQVQAERATTETFPFVAHASDRAIKLALNSQRAPDCAFVAVYLDNPTPAVSCQYGAPMGRASGNLDRDSLELWRARQVPLDAGGYDRGGAYWGCRSGGMRLYAVQDGMGNLAFIDARDGRHAIAQLQES